MMYLACDKFSIFGQTVGRGSHFGSPAAALKPVFAVGGSASRGMNFRCNLFLFFLTLDDLYIVPHSE